MTITMPDVPVCSADGRYTYFDTHKGVGVVGYGTTLERAFEGAAEATFALLADLTHVRPQRTLPVSFIEADEARALRRWLDLLIEAARQHQLVFCEFHVQREQERWWGCATGQRRHGTLARELDVVRAGGSGAAVRRTPRGWEASCVVECARPAAADARRTAVRPVSG
ncbi:MAG TPA: archease [Burkholderiales bacterium]|nr:archease [Burkholderiales bacterium]